MWKLAASLGITMLAPVAAALAQPLTAAFTYQGQLEDGGAPADAVYDLRFRLFTTALGTTQIGPTIDVADRDFAGSGGLFSTNLDFTGAAYDGNQRWLQVEVRPGASTGPFTPLVPRQQLSTTPHATLAVRALSNAPHSLDNAYDDGRTINADAGAVQILGTGGLAVRGATSIGDATTGGTLNVNISTTGNRVLRLGVQSGRGGEIEGFQEDGTTRNFALEPDASGSGAFLTIEAGAGTDGGVFIDGSVSAGSPNHRTQFMGVSDVTIDGNLTGNAAVQLPSDAVAAGEILDEPGLASASQDSINMALTTTPASINSRSITVPAAGFVIVLATVEVSVQHTGPSGASIIMGVSNSATTLPPSQEFSFLMPSALPVGTYNFTISPHGVFPVTAGTHTFHIVGYEIVGAGVVNDMQLTLLFIPTSYGAVSLPPPGGGDEGERSLASARGPQTPEEIAAEIRQETERQLAAMRVEQERQRLEMQQLRADLAEVLRRQRVGAAE